LGKTKTITHGITMSDNDCNRDATNLNGRLGLRHCLHKNK